MFDLPTETIALALIVLGLLSAAGVMVFLRARRPLASAGRSGEAGPRPEIDAGPSAAAFERRDPDEDPGKGVLVVSASGRILHANAALRDWLYLPEHAAFNLEFLARRSQPPDHILDLCAGPARRSFTLQGLAFEGESHRIDTGGAPAIVVLLTRPELADLAQGDHPDAGGIEALRAINAAMAAGPDLTDTIRAILESVERLIPADITEITVLDATEEQLLPYRLTGPPSPDRALQADEERYSIDGSLSGSLVRSQGALVHHPGQDTPENGREHAKPYPFQAYIGVPLLTGDAVIGTLELASLTDRTYSKQDLDTLELLAGQAAVTLSHAMTRASEARRSAELSGLAALTQSVGSLQEPQDLFRHLIERIHPLLDVEMLGFLLYDENAQTLEAAVPFEGIPDDFARAIVSRIESGSHAQEIILALETITAHPAPGDPRLEALGLAGMVGGNGVRSTALAPLTLGGRSLGYLQAANRRSGGAFTADELRILAIAAGQAAAIIDNARLLEESRRRRRQAEALRRIAAIASSAATLDEILAFSLTEIARLLGAEKGAIFLQDESQYTLRLHKDSVFGLEPEELADQLDLKLEDPGYAQSVTGSQQARVFARRSASLEGDPLYKPLVNRLDVESALAVPLIVSGRSFGELIFGSRQLDFFGPGEIEMASTSAGQIAGAIERALVKSQTDETLRRRVEELTALTRISRELNTSFDLNGLLQLIHGEALATTGAACGAILLLDKGDALNPDREIALLTGDERTGARLSTLESEILQTRTSARIVNFEPDGPHDPPHPGVAESLVAPIHFRTEIIGLFNLHATARGTFNRETLESTEALAVQAGIALGNAVRFRDEIRNSQQIQRRFDALNSLFAIHRELEAAGPELSQALDLIAGGISRSMGYEVVIISTYEPGSGTLSRTAVRGFSADAFEELKQVRIPWTNLEELIQPEFRYEDVYFIPADRTPIVPPDFDLVISLDPAEDREERAYWQAQDLFFAPLYDPDGEPLGVISIDAPENRLRPDQADFEILTMYADQAARQIHQNRSRPDAQTGPEGETNGAHAAERAPALPETLATLLRKDLSQSAAIHNLGRKTARVQGALELVQAVNGLKKRSQVYETIGSELVANLGFDQSFVVLPSGGGINLVAQGGEIPNGVNPEALLGQRNPLRQALQSGELMLEPGIRANGSAGWDHAPLLKQLNVESFICIPIRDPDGGNGVEAAFLGVSREAQPAFTAEDHEVYDVLSRQIAAALQKIDLVEQTEERLREVDLLLDFGRRLGSLNTDEIVRSLTENALEVSEGAQAAMTALWDAGSERLVPENPTGYPDNRAMRAVRFPAGRTLPGRVFSEGIPLRIAELNIAQDYNLPYEDLMKYQEATRSTAPIASLVVPITSGKAVLGVLILDSFSEPDVFTAEDEALIGSLARQTGLILENARLLEEANRRAVQLESLTGVATTITSDLKVERITSSLLAHLAHVIPFETGTLWFRQGQELTIRATQGFSDDEKRIGLAVSIDDSRLLRDMVASGEPINVKDVEDDERFVSSGGFPHRSWLGIPLIAKGEVVGVIALEKDEVGFYNNEHIQVATTFAGQAAVALENARLFEDHLRRTKELNERTERLDLLNQLSTAFSATLDTRHIFQFTADRMREAFDCRAVTAVRIDTAGEGLLTAESPGDVEVEETPFDLGPFEQLRESFGIQIIGDVRDDPSLEPLAAFWDSHGTRAAAVISLAAGSELHGLMILHGEKRLSSGEIDLARTIGNQAAIALQNARLYDRARELAGDLEQRVEARTRELELAHERTETMLGIITELSASLDMDIVLNRTLALINRIAGADQGTIIISNPADDSSLRRSVQGYSAPAASGAKTVSRVLYEKLAGRVIEAREPILIDDLSKDDRLGGIQRLGQRSALATPLMLGAEALGALMLFHQEPARFNAHHLDLIQSAAKQVAIAVNNAHLYLLIRDQAERLGGMLRSQQIESSRLLAILESVVDGVIVTGADGQISVFNRAAEQILRLSPEDVIGRGLESFTGLFGKAGKTWMQTIRTWSADPDAFDPDEAFSEEIILDDDRVLAVNLSPVFSPHEFLGTVSIFRDITHLIEVDRMKSEFVATVSHELRTPLTSIKGYVDVLLMGAAGDLDDQQRDFLEIAQANTERLNVLVDDLLEVSRIEAGRISLNLQPVDVPEIAAEIATDYTLRSEEEKKNITILIDSGGNEPRAHADPDRVRQVLDNLVGNAYNYTPEEGRVEVEFAHAGDLLEVRVRDNGVGIPPEEQEQVFDRFYRGEAPLSTAVAGTGLGLSIVRNLVELHGGTIRLESAGLPGKGSTFIFTLPVFPEEEAGTPHHALDPET